MTDTITFQEAADFLQVSEPYLAKLLEKGLIPRRKTGQNLLLDDIKEYKKRSKEKSRQLLDELTREAQKLGLGY